MKKLFLLINIIFYSILLNGQGFLKAEEKNIVNNNGNFLIRSMGIGGWFVKEPYMFGLNGEEDRGQHKIHQDIIDLIGQEKFEIFDQSWQSNFFQEQDLIEIKELGFNTIRLPLHFNLFTLAIENEPILGIDTWKQSGFNTLDTILSWCKKHEIYLILDLHAAPGGQGKNGNINDYDPNKPSLWESEENERKYLALWEKLAERYANEEWIGGYDPMNEPNWGFENIDGNENGCFETTNIPLRNLYSKIIPAIRKHDQNHIIMIEGNCWGNNHSGLWPLPVEDINVAISFYKYWNENNLESIQEFLSMRETYNVPLWMSESGENTNLWYREAVELLEENNIGWSWWTWKKMESNSGSFSVKKPTAYDHLVNYWSHNNQAGIPNIDSAFTTLMQLTENLLLNNCIKNSESINALLNIKKNCTSKPSLENEYINALDYCNSEGIIPYSDHIGNFSDKDWVAYTIDISTAGTYQIEYQIATNEDNALLTLESYGGASVYETIDVPNTFGWYNWTTVSHEVLLKSGYQQIAIVSETSPFNIKSFSIKPIGVINKLIDTESTIFIAFPNPAKNYILLSLETDWTLLNNIGTILKHGAGIQIDLSTYSKGIYFIQTNYGFFKFIKE